MGLRLGGELEKGDGRKEGLHSSSAEPGNMDTFHPNIAAGFSEEFIENILSRFGCTAMSRWQFGNVGAMQGDRASGTN